MPDIVSLFPDLLETFDRWVALALGQLSGEGGPWGLLAFLPPVILAALSRMPLHIAIVLLLTVTCFALARLDEPGLALLVHAMSYAVAFHSFSARKQRHRANVAAAQLSRLSLEVTTFLDGLERRSRDADRARSAVVETLKPREQA